MVQQERRLSFTSVGLGIGSFPPEVHDQPTIINAAVYFDSTDCPLVSDIAVLVVEPLLKYERLSKVFDPKTERMRPSHQNFTIDDFVREISVDGDSASTNQIIFDHSQDPLDDGRDDLPWWEILLVRNKGAGDSACVLRFHHVIGDGIALVSAFQKILTDEEGNEIQTPFSFNGGASRRERKGKGCLSTTASLIQATGHVLTLGMTKFDDDIAFSKMNNATLSYSGKRSVVIFPTIPLDFVKKLKAAAQVSVNDILMTCISQAIHDYCKSQNDQVLATKASKIQCRALLPVAFPRSQEELDDPATAMTNKWSLVSCDMGVGYSDVEERLRYIHAKTTEMKEKPRAFMQLAVQNKLCPKLPLSLNRKVVFDTFARHSCVLTNVPGPTKKCLFAGKKIKGVQVFVQNLLTQVDLISYAGNVYGNIVYDADELPDFEVMSKLFFEAMVELAERLNVEVPMTV